MAAPLPDESLSGHCSVIDGDTLYVLSPKSFQALPLKSNATWTSLDVGTSVTNPACVRAVPNGDESQAALYVVGGEADDGDYGGLQRYVFSTKSWETIKPPTTDMQGRTTHGVAYLNDSSSILVYAGWQASAPSTMSSQTFLISTESPYNIESFTSKAPPVSDPIMLTWNSSAAVMVGGSDTNKAVWTFSRDKGWQQLDTTLTSALSGSAKGALISGGDGSKVLEVYDASVSPNQVAQYVLLGAHGVTASTGETVGNSSRKSNPSRKRKRDLTLADWPTYNSTSAPTTKRSDYSVAQNDDGSMAVIAGGNDDSPIDIFNTTGNTWVSNEAFFGDASSQVPLTSASSASPTSLPTSTSSKATSTPSAAASGDHHSKHSDGGKIAGIVLGVLCGIAAILIVALLFFRRRKQRMAQQKAQMDEKADRMSFQDRGASFMKEAGGSVSSAAPVLPPPNHRFHDGKYDPRSSFAILAGKLGADRFSQRFSKYSNTTSNANTDLEPPKPMYSNQNDSNTSLAIISGRYKSHERSAANKASFDSTAKLVRSPQTPQHTEDLLELEEMDRQAGAHIPRKPIDPNGQLAPASVRVVAQIDSPDMQNKKRSSGWSRYFANQSDGGVYNPAAQNASTASLSDYTPSRNPSAVVPPLDIGHLHPNASSRLSVVPNGRPSFSHSIEDFAARGASLDGAQGQRADFHTGQSLESQGYLDSHDSFSSSRRHSLSSMASHDFFHQHDESWTPVNAGVAHPVRSGSASAIKEVHIPPSPALSTSYFPRPPSSTYTNDRDSRMPSLTPDSLGRALSPPAAVAIPGPAARGGGGGGGFFPGSGTRALHDRPAAARKIGPLHPGTLAALRFGPAESNGSKGLGINTDENRDSSATIWPSAGPMTQEDRERVFREKAERDRAEKARKDERKTQTSDMSWVDIGQR